MLDGGIESGVIGSGDVKFTQINEDFGVLVGAHGGWLINHQLLLGIGGYGLVNDISASWDAADYYNYLWRPQITFGYGGAYVQYFIEPNNMVHTSFSVLVGAGGVAYRSKSTADYPVENSLNFSERDNDHTSAVAFFVLEPGVSVEFNVASFFKLGVNASYRYVNGTDIVGIKDSDLSGFSAGLAFQFGIF